MGNHKEMSIKGKSEGNHGESQGSHGKPQVNHGKSQGNQKGIMGNHKRIMWNHKGITKVDDGILELTKKSYDKDTHIKYHYLIKQTTKSKTGEKIKFLWAKKKKTVSLDDFHTWYFVYSFTFLIISRCLEKSAKKKS